MSSTVKKIVNNAIAKATRPNAIAHIKNIMSHVRWRRQAPVGYIEPDGAYGLSLPQITGRTVSFTCDFSRFKLPTTLPPGFLTIEGRRTIKSPVIVRVTRTHGVLGSGTVNHWYIKTTNGFAIVHRSGVVQVSSPNATGQVARQLERILPGLSNPKIVKFDARMDVNRSLKLESIHRFFPYSLGTWLYEPELANRAEVRWKSPSMTLIMYMTGQIQIFGASKPREAMDVVRRIIDHVTPQHMFRSSRYGGWGTGAKPLSKTEKLEKNRMNKLNVRHPWVTGYNQIPPPGQYIRPGPNGKPRLYNIPANPKLSAAKVEKAYQKAGIHMPQHVRNIFRTLEATMVFYGASKGADRAPSWNAKKNGHYVAPGPGKQPYFYKLPKNLKGGFETARSRYTKAGINVPHHVRNLFGVGTPNRSPVLNRPTMHVVQNTTVNGKSYKKLTTNQLVAIARNLGNAGANSKMTKAVLFERIKNKATIKKASPVRTPNVTVNGRNYIFSNDPNNQRIIRNGRKRVFSTLPKAEREAIAKAYLGNIYKTLEPKNWYNGMRVTKMTNIS